MANLRDIQKRINSVKSTEQITRTMEMVSSAKITGATKRVVAATPYSNAMEEMLQRLSTQVASSQHPLLAEHESLKAAVVVAIASDRGLAGGFNTNVVRHCDKIISQLEDEGAEEVHVIACGKKAIAYFKYRGYKTLMEYKDLSADPTLDEAREIAKVVSDMYTSGKADRVIMVYNHARNAADQDLIEEQLLPVRPSVADDSGAEEAQAESGDAKDKVIKGSFEFEPDAETVLTELLPGYLDTSVYHGLIDSAAAEQGARRKAMKAATDNANEMIDTLSRVFNRARQGAITTEITEIVGGAAAAEG